MFDKPVYHFISRVGRIILLKPLSWRFRWMAFSARIKADELMREVSSGELRKKIHVGRVNRNLLEREVRLLTTRPYLFRHYADALEKGIVPKDLAASHWFWRLF